MLLAWHKLGSVHSPVHISAPALFRFVSFHVLLFLFTVRLLKKQEKQNKKIVRDAFFLVDVPLGISASFFFFVLFVLNK